jgi:hypothetical protein
VKRSGNSGSGERLSRTELGAKRHEAGHLLLGETELVTASLRKFDVGDAIRKGSRGSHAPILAGEMRYLSVAHEVPPITLGGMTSRIARFDGFARARYLRVAGQLAFGLWIIGWLVFAVLIGIRASASLVSAVAALICILFAVSFGLQVASRRLAWRELTRLVARDDLSATRSRGLPRVR